MSNETLTGINFDKINIASENSNVYKEECMLCFDTPESEGGLNICLNTFQAFCPEHTKLYFQHTGNNIFMNIKVMKTEKPKEEQKKITKLAIGVEGGFNGDDTDKYKYEELISLVCLHPINRIVPFPDFSLPEKINMSIQSIMNATSASKKEDISVWEEEEIKETKYAQDLKQINPDKKKIPKSGWMCFGCDLTENLWMCLTCGEIGCGRKYFDGSGGNNHGILHNEQTGHPLVVKLGTITPNGSADVYSYPDANLVKDPLLEKHLEFFGINISEMKKTDKSMAELNLDANINFDSHRIQQSGKDVYGPRMTGIKNIGNSCYLASVMQVLFSIPEFESKYIDPDMKSYVKNISKNPADLLDIQMSKLCNGLVSGKYSQIRYVDVPKKNDKGEEIDGEMEMIPAEQDGIPPKSFKMLVGKGHPEFSTSRQQDSLEFLQYVLQLIERNERLKDSNQDPTHLFKFIVEERIQCSESHAVKYTEREDNILNLPVPLEAATNRKEYEEFEEKQKEIKIEEEKRKEAEKNGSIKETVKPSASEKLEIVRPHVPMAECIKSFAETEAVQGFYSSAVKKKTIALKKTRMKTFPDYLVVSVRRFVLDGWALRKFDVFIDNPQEIDLSALRGTGLQPGEKQLPQEAPEEKVEEAPKINQSIVEQLTSMGFPQTRSENAVYHTNNAGAEQAMSWIFEHEDDPMIDIPISQQLKSKSSKESATNIPPEDLISSLTAMEFSRDHAIFALQKTNNSAERAVDFIFNHMDEIDGLIAQEKQTSSSSTTSSNSKSETKKKAPTDGSSKYELFAFISHIGNNTASGHYVCHIKKDGGWLIFNDRKVSVCEEPPFDMGYLYFYRRK